MYDLFKKYPTSKIVLTVWIAFASLYVVYGEYGRLKVFVAQRAYNQGVTDSVTKLLSEAKNCQPIPVTAGDVKVEFIALECLKTPAGEDASK